ncbi:MAG: FAD-binding protein [Desulfovibrionaceae bacterium]|nr:FAD-binding protein [Desulfovibrionaceae bacterium]
MQIIDSSPMKQKTTMKLGGNAYQELIIESYDDADILLHHIQKNPLPCYILGGGSNLLIDSEPLNAYVIRSTYTHPCKVVQETEKYIHIQAPLSMPLQRFVLQAIGYGAQGFEGLAGVPGTLGGAIAMNAGSFGSEVARYLASLDILSLSEGIMQCTQESFTRGYRSFSIKHHDAPYIGLSALFICPKASPTQLRSTFKAHLATKKERQPLQAHSAGCVFKNINGTSTGLLLEEAGMKNISTEHFHFSSQHANFLLHDGNGTLDEALFLLEKAKQIISERYAHTLELEVRIWTTRNI